MTAGTKPSHRRQGLFQACFDRLQVDPNRNMLVSREPEHRRHHRFAMRSHYQEVQAARARAAVQPRPSRAIAHAGPCDDCFGGAATATKFIPERLSYELRELSIRKQNLRFRKSTSAFRNHSSAPFGLGGLLAAALAADSLEAGDGNRLDANGRFRRPTGPP